MSVTRMNGEKKAKNNGLELFFSVTRHSWHKCWAKTFDAFKVLLVSFIQLGVKVTKKRRIKHRELFFSSFPKCTWPWNFPTNWECIKRPLLGLNKCQKAVSIVLGISLVQQTCVSDQIPTNKMGLVNQITNNLDKVWKSMKNWKEYCMQMMEKWKNIRLSNLYCHAISIEL